MVDFLDRGELLLVLQGFNPWWVGKTFEVPEFRRLAFWVSKRYLTDPSLRRAVLLSGPRRVGKTTVLLQLAKSMSERGECPPKSILYLSLDHPMLKLVSLPEILRLYHENVYPEGKPVFLFLDEVQYSDDWELHLKQIIDHKPEYRILATGSATVVHQRDLIDSGVGRWIRVAMPTLSFYEFVRICGEDNTEIPDDIRPVDLFNMCNSELLQLAARFRPLMPLFQRYLLVGGFPETAKMIDVGLCQRLLREDVVERVLKRDMTALFGIRNVNDLEKLFIYLCIHSGNIIEVKTCAQALSISPNTVSNYLAALEKTGLIFRLPPVPTHGKKILKARYKIYLADAALRNAVLLRGEEILSNSNEMGLIVETAILRHLYAYYYQDNPEIGYWRDPKRKREVDIVVRSPSYVIPVEVKYRENAFLDPTAGIWLFCQQEKATWAYWVTKQEHDFGVTAGKGLSTSILKIPAHIFAYLLGQAERLLAGVDKPGRG